MKETLAILFLLFSSAASAQPVDDESNPLTAAGIVYAQSYAIERIQIWCAKEDPSSADAIKQARRTWDERHAVLMEKTPKILQSKVSLEERKALAAEMRVENDKIVNKLASFPKAERIKWCQGAAQKITSPQMDLMHRKALVKAITGYEARP